jgi:hypothetical protein
MEKTTEAGDNKTQSAVVAALVIGLLVGFFIGRSWEVPVEVEIAVDIAKTENIEEVSDAADSLDVKEGAKETVKTEAVSMADVVGTVAVADQGAGKTVLVSKVTLSDAGWVVVREDTGSGMGKILGAQWLPLGIHENVSVDLLRAIEANKNYFVALYDDNGDKKFDKVTDLPIAADGKVVSGVFSAK